MTTNKFFPIQTETACQLKWAWSTIFLNSGLTKSCHRTGTSVLTPENFFNFHNTSIKLDDRSKMLNGQWPANSCQYCQKLEEVGKISDRIRQNSIPNLTPIELTDNITEINVSPTIVEVYFNNTCNLGCLYCNPELSSIIELENKKFGKFEHHGVKLDNSTTYYTNLVPYFWQWFPEGFPKIKRLHILGGEPFYQKEFDTLLEMIEKYPNPQCEVNIVTNLMIPKKKLEKYIDVFKKLLISRKIKRIDITCSIDCWGPSQEYVRWGLDLTQWEENFNLLIQNKWIYLNINQTISSLTIKTMDILLLKLSEWRSTRKIGHWFSGVVEAPDYLTADIFGSNEFFNDIEKILKLMPTETDEDLMAYNYMKSLTTKITASDQNISEINNLIVYLNEKDRRRNTNWKEVFPWLIKYEQLCGIIK